MASGSAPVQLAVAIPTPNPCIMLSGQQAGAWEDERENHSGCEPQLT